MGKAERERRHLAALARIDHVHSVVGRGDRMRIDHEGTVLERARLLEDEVGSHRATELGLAALDRLLQLAEEQSAPQREIVDFVAALWNRQPLPLATLRGVPTRVADDMLTVLDAFRWARLDLVEHVEGGPRRVGRLVERRRVATT